MPGKTPEVGDAIWVERHQPLANGKIVYASEEEDEVIVQFFDEEGRDPTQMIDSFTWDEVARAWSDRFGGQYQIRGRE